MPHETQRSETQLFGEVRIAFPYHFEKRTETAGKIKLNTPRNDALLLVPKLGPPESCANYLKLAGMAMEAATKAWQGWPDGGKWPIQDGDIPHVSKPKPGEKPLTPEQIAERNKWRTGCWVIEVRNSLPVGPKVAVLQNGRIVEIPAQDVNGMRLYKSGDYGFVSMNAFTYHFDGGGWGVNYSYEGVTYTRPGELIGNGPKSASQMFAGIPMTGGMPAAGAPVPQTPSAAPAPGGAPMPPLPPTPSVAPLPVTASPATAPSATAAAPMPTVSAAAPRPPMPPVPAAAGAPPLPPIPGR